MTVYNNTAAVTVALLMLLTGHLAWTGACLCSEDGDKSVDKERPRPWERLRSQLDPEVIFERSLQLVDTRKTPSDRRSIALKIFSDPDIRDVPALLATLRDPAADRSLKYACIYPLSVLPDKRVVDYLIEFVTDKDIGRGADEQLVKILGVTMDLDNRFDESEEGLRREKLQHEWRQWWNEHRDTAPLFSIMAYTSDPLIFTSKEEYDPVKLRKQIEGPPTD